MSGLISTFCGCPSSKSSPSYSIVADESVILNVQIFILFSDRQNLGKGVTGCDTDFLQSFPYSVTETFNLDAFDDNLAVGPTTKPQHIEANTS
mmetsp:Transcript_15275/g.41558  ORF Transcript_15275/g.41558 Transcript_15275/m.41558 type:complete len:93 (+) Transcript_15275:582-860(+)